MRGILNKLDPIVSSQELCEALVTVLSTYFGSHVVLKKIERRISDYCSSYIIEELDVELADGRRLELIFKDLGEQAMLTEASQTKPSFCYNPLREIETYRDILAHQQLGTAEFYGAVVQPEIGRYWLFLERLEPTLLWQMGEFDVWIWAARWLGRMHGILATSTALRRRAETHLIRYDKEFYRRWINRACAFISGGGRHGAMDWLLNRYERVIERLLELPPTVIHGEFFVSNVLVANPQSEAFLRVCPVDWEMAAIGPGLVDLAALTSGEWTTEQRNAMAVAYYEALPDLMRKDWPFERFLTDIDYCRLHQAVQLLGWSANWSAPPEHAQDWVEEALTLARKLRL